MDGTLRTACKEMEQDLVLYYYREDGEAERSRVETHMESCASCRGFLEDLHKLLPATVKADEPPEIFWESYSREMRRKLEATESKTPRWKELLSFLRPWPVPALAAAMVFIVALTFTLSRTWNRQELQLTEATPPEIRLIAENLDFLRLLDFIETMDLLQEVEGARSGEGTV